MSSLVPEEPGSMPPIAAYNLCLFPILPSCVICHAGDKRLLRSSERREVGHPRQRRHLQEPVLLQMLGEPPKQLHNQKVEGAERRVPLNSC